MPGARRVDVHLDDAGIGRDRELVDPRSRAAAGSPRCAPAARARAPTSSTAPTSARYSSTASTGGMKMCSIPSRGSTQRAVRTSPGRRLGASRRRLAAAVRSPGARGSPARAAGAPPADRARAICVARPFGLPRAAPSSGSRKPIGESPGSRNRRSPRNDQRAALPADRRRRRRRARAAAARSPTTSPGRLPNTRASRARSTGIVEPALEHVDVRGQPPLAPQVVEDVLVAGSAELGARPSRSASAVTNPCASWRRRGAPAFSSANSSGRSRSARRRGGSSRSSAQRGSGSPGYHLPCPWCSRPPGAKRARSRRSSLSASARLSAPSAAVFHSARVAVVDRDERRLAAHRQPHVVPLRDRASTACAEAIDRRPLVLAVGLGDARRLRRCRCTLISKVELLVDLVVLGVALEGERAADGAAAVDGRRCRPAGCAPRRPAGRWSASKPIQPAPGR